MGCINSKPDTAPVGAMNYASDQQPSTTSQGKAKGKGKQDKAKEKETNINQIKEKTAEKKTEGKHKKKKDGTSGQGQQPIQSGKPVPQHPYNSVAQCQDNRGAQYQEDRGVQYQDNRGTQYQDNRGAQCQVPRGHGDTPITHNTPTGDQHQKQGKPDSSGKMVKGEATMIVPSSQNVRVKDKKGMKAISQLQTEKNKLEGEVKELTARNQRGREYLDKLESEKKEQDKVIPTLNAKLLKEKAELTNRVQDCRLKDDQIWKLTDECERLRKDKEQLLSRLSAMAGAKMTDNNPNITDLSDINRPTKLAEKYTELYDNAWTDAFAALHEKEKKSEEDAIQLMLGAFVKLFTECKKRADDQLHALLTAVVPFRRDGEDLSEVIKPLKDRRKRIIRSEIKELEQIVDDILQNISFKEDGNQTPVKDYLAKSLELCWLMVIQDPPIFVDCKLNIKGETFNKNLFREYTVSGQNIYFVVWPILYLQEGGDVLCKGVAQGMKEYDSKRNYATTFAGATIIKVLGENVNQQDELSRSFDERHSSSYKTSVSSTTTQSSTKPKQTGAKQNHATSTVTTSDANTKFNAPQLNVARDTINKTQSVNVASSSTEQPIPSEITHV